MPPGQNPKSPQTCGQLCAVWRLHHPSGSADGCHCWALLSLRVVPVSGGRIKGGVGVWVCVGGVGEGVAKLLRQFLKDIFVRCMGL